jgi:NADH-quinone oxidoreductase subunit D
MSQEAKASEQTLDPNAEPKCTFEAGLVETGDYYTRNFLEGPSEDSLVLNMGPQHPSTHGVLRIVLELDGEYIKKAEPVLGYIHRNHEHMGQTKSWTQFLPNMGRADYLHALAWNWAYVGAVEKLAGIEVPERAECLRVITCELNRITSHLLWWGAYLLDLGAFTPIMYAFTDREYLMDLLQMVTGSRLTYCYFRFGGVSHDATDEFVDGVREFIPYFRKRLPMYKALVSDNIILRKRVEDVGHITPEMCRRYGATGPVVRGSGVAYDVRRAEPYSLYPDFDFRVPTYPEGDAMARYMVRMDELEQSLRITEQALDRLEKAEGKHLDKKAPKATFKPPQGEAYFATEGARGKIGIMVVSDGGLKPYRVKLRAPGFSNLSLFAETSKGTILADAVSILGSLDLVIPEIDR